MLRIVVVIFDALREFVMAKYLMSVSDGRSAIIFFSDGK